MTQEDRFRKAQSYRETRIQAFTGEGDKEVPLAKWDLKRMYGYIRAQFRATTRENVRVLLDEARYLEETSIELELVSHILDRAGVPEEAGSVPERLRMLVLAYEQEIDTLRARLAACERDAARYRWLKERFLGAHFGYEGTVPPSCVLTFKVPDTMRVSGNLDVTIDAALTTDDDFGPNDGHARTVRRTPPQDAATTRGEG